MSLCLVLHDLGGAPADAEKAFFEAIYEIAPDHWPVTGRAVLVGTEVSPAYLRDHLLQALAPTGTQPALLLVTRVPRDLAWHNLPSDGVAWLQEMLG
ncbi:MAG: hypothetical protein QJR07_05220 [Acetobacteraceae bacterium]|nr:hypothetical protein [Acetobacteraceae bacterium]MBX6747601.1 hypothetical protein [Acetobacteraceae bacterium]MDI3306485.1 hypothetical protein [Acetobacteraceae bacterium]